MTDLDTLVGTFSVAVAINEAGQIIGNFITAGGEIHAFVATIGSPNQPPTASAGGPYTAYEDTPLAMSGAASDPDLDTLTYSWSVDSALCSFDDYSALNPSLTCSDIGNFTATLTVSDGVNPPVTSDAAVTVIFD